MFSRILGLFGIGSRSPGQGAAAAAMTAPRFIQAPPEYVRRSESKSSQLATRYDLIAIDIDGTLLDSQRGLPESVIRAIRAARAAGVQVVLSSARPPRNAQQVQKKLGFESQMICYNGALVCDSSDLSVVHHAALDHALALAAVREARQIAPQVQLRIDVIDKWYTDRALGHVEANTASYNLPTRVDAIENILTEPVTRLTFLDQSQTISRIRNRLNAKFGRQIGIQRTENRLLQLLSPGIDKALALSKVADHYGVSQDRVMAIGDGPNDLEMMQWAGCAVAMGNSYPEVFEVAQHRVATNDRGGVAEAILKYVLTRSPTGDRKVA